MVLNGEMECEIIMSWARLGGICCAAKELVFNLGLGVLSPSKTQNAVKCLKVVL
jgi:hypothetical protein